MDDSVKLRFCPECGQEIQHKYRFCSSCGTDLNKWIAQLNKEKTESEGIRGEDTSAQTQNQVTSSTYTPPAQVAERPYFSSAETPELFIEEELKRQITSLGFLLLGFLGRFILVYDTLPGLKILLGAIVIITITSFSHIMLTKNYAVGQGTTVRLHSSRNSNLNALILNSLLLGVYPTTYDLSEEGDEETSKGKILGIEVLIGLGIAGLLFIIPTFAYYPEALKLLMVTFYCTYVLIKMIPTPWTPGQLIRQWSGLFSFAMTIGSVLLLAVLIGFN
ncbi:MAG: zinc ribbon domain-containing protein [Candidatus Heimdallarchaeota archaeon]|nr:zinc ribbon domain-containing protein [Candidatus Heimdallarchaeota archaeon]MCK5048216.1 zinc ribbon domain-containing protein [Candidatus Heimdallarchaeota archaeon]